MDLDELNGLILQCETCIKDAEKAKYQVDKQKQISKGQKEKML